MSKQSLPIKDGNGTLTTLQVDSGSYGLIPNHFISSSASDPLWVTGTVDVSPSISVSASITASVPAQITASISSSVSEPIYLTGSVYVADTFSDAGNLSLLVKTTGSSKVTVDNQYADQAFANLVNSCISLAPTTSSLLVTTTGSSAITINNTSADQAFINLANSSISLAPSTSSLLVTTTGSSVVSINNNNADQAFTNLVNSCISLNPTESAFIVQITGSSAINVQNDSSSALTVVSKPAKVVQKLSGPPTFLDWGNETSGTAGIEESDNRKGLIINNMSNYTFYISIGSGSTNGFTISDVTKPPDVYSFAIYSSGTYFADETTVNCFHGIYLPSASFPDPNANFITITTIKYS